MDKATKFPRVVYRANFDAIHGSTVTSEIATKETSKTYTIDGKRTFKYTTTPVVTKYFLSYKDAWLWAWKEEDMTTYAGRLLIHIMKGAPEPINPNKRSN